MAEKEGLAGMSPCSYKSGVDGLKIYLAFPLLGQWFLNRNIFAFMHLLSYDISVMYVFKFIDVLV